MFIPRTFIGAMVLTFGLCYLGVNAHAQNDPIFEQGFKPFGSFQSGDIDSVNILNRELNLHIPLYSLPQRGGKLHMGFYLPYQANLWVPWQFDSDCSSTCYMYIPPQNTVGDTGTDFLVFLDRNPNQTYHAWVTSADGAVHETGVLSVDGTGYRGGPTPPLTCPFTDSVTDRNGVIYKFGCTTSQSSSQFSYFEDPNGNKITGNYDSFGSLVSWTDSMGRTSLAGQTTTDFGGCTGPLPTVAAGLRPVPSINGGTRTFKYCYATVHLQNMNLCGYDQTRCIDDSTGSYSYLQAIVLPNGTSWTFTYDSADPNNPSSVGWGDLTKITFPTGGSISYTWVSSGQIGACSSGYGWGGPIVRVLSSRTLDANDGQGPHTWTYTKPTNFVTNVQDPLGNQTVHTFTVIPNGTSSISCKLHETLTQRYLGTSTSGTLKQTDATDYIKAENYGSSYPADNPDFVANRITTTVGGQQKKVEMDYNYPVLDFGTYPLTDGNVVARREYDYGSPGALLRTTTTAYLANSNSNYLNKNLISLPSSVKVQNGAGTQQGYTTFSYDEYSLASSGITTQHDSSPPNGIYRGNLTSTHHWLNGSSASTTNCPISVSNGYLVSFNIYFDTGMVQKATDSCGTSAGVANHTTTFAYSSTYAGAYPTTITNPLSQSTTNGYDFNTGFLSSMVDPNNQTTTYSYDSLTVRPMQISYPDLGQVNFCYSDITGSPCYTSVPPYKAVATQKITSTSQNKITTNIFDGVGRLKETQLNSDPAGTVYNDIVYDAVGRKSKIWNPTRCNPAQTNCGESTWGFTTYNYDPLDRVTSVVEQDSSTVSTDYSAFPCITVTDEAGKKRKSCSDGLGRMTSVSEDPNVLNYLTSYSYDALDNLLSVTQNSSRQRTFAYDSLSRLLCAANPEIQIVACPNPDTGSYTAGTMRYAYDANGNLTTKTVPKQNQTSASLTVVTTYGYDALNRMISKSYNDGSTQGRAYYYDTLSTWGYPSPNTIGRLTAESDIANVFSFRNYDAMGRVYQLWSCLPSNCTGNPNVGPYYTESLYDLAGDLASLTYPSGRKVTYQYNNAMQPTLVTFASYGGNAVNYNYLSGATYAPTGVPASSTLGSGVTESASYNNRLQPCNFQAATGTFTWLNRTNNFYPTAGVNCQPGSGGNNGNVVSIADNLQSNRSQSFGYDNLNRISTAQSAATSGVDCWGQSFGYDAWANLLAENVTKCSGTQLTVGVNANNRITNTGFSYDAAGDLLTDGISTYAYDGESRIKTLNTTGATYTYDGMGQRVRKQVGSDAVDYIYLNGRPIAERKANWDWSDYIYEGSHRLARADNYEDRIQTGGNNCSSCGWQWSIFWFPNAGGLNGYVVQSGDKLYLRQWQSTGAEGGPGLWFTDGTNTGNVTYDQDGHASNADTSSLVWHYRRIDLSSLAGKTINNAGLITEGYTAPGNWSIYYNDVVLVSGDGTVRPLYNREPSISLVVSGSSGSTRSYVVSHDTGAGPYSQGTATTYYHGDHLGSARLMTSENGYPTWSSAFLPFGQEWNPQITVNHYKFTGKERDSESGLDNFGARYDSSQYGRFMTPDAMGNAAADPNNPQSWNLYSYVLNNPLKFVDPTGNWCVWEDHTHDDDPNSGGASHEDCNSQGGHWDPGDTITGMDENGNLDQHITVDASDPNSIDTTSASFANCVKQGGDDTSVQHAIQWASGGRLGNSWLSSALFGNPFSGGIQLGQDVSNYTGQGGGNATSLGAGLGAGPAADYGATHIPNVTVAVSAAVSARASVATATSQTVVTASGEASAVLPIGQMARSALGVLGKGLAKLGNGLVLPVSMTGTAFAATVCSIGR
jgi:RHS repeat-associated protein